MSHADTLKSCSRELLIKFEKYYPKEYAELTDERVLVRVDAFRWLDCFKLGWDR